MEEVPQTNSSVPQSSPQQPQPMRQPPERKEKTKRLGEVLLVVVLLVGLVGGALIGYGLSYSTFNGKIGDLQRQLQNLPPTNATYVSYANTSYVMGDNVSLVGLYQQVKSSVVVVQDLVPVYNMFGFLRGYSQQQGSGFVTFVDNQSVIVTNYHVMKNAINTTVTFSNGDSYPATLVGSDPLADLAVLTINVPSIDLLPLTIISSRSLQVGDPVVAVGSPYGLSGTLTTGVVSALGRTITETDGTQNSGIDIPDVIQTSTAINPGNSGGPLVNYRGEVVGITTAAVSNSEGLGFAIPSETILRELTSLVRNGSYDQHPSIDASGTDMNYQIAQAIGTNITYGWLVENVSTQNGLRAGTTQVTAGASTITIGGDVIIGINGTRISNVDDLLSYLEQHTSPGQKVNFTVIRDSQTQTIDVTIGKVSA
jgi:S1-C subfamily serine protease